jgi:adenosylcobinamide-GDP ribazoletransferase
VSSLVDGLRLAVGTLTAIRVAPPTRVDRSVARVAMLLAPVAVLPVGLTAALAGALHPWLGLPPLVAAALAIVAVALGSRGLHLDGLADTADGLGSGYDRERALAVMRLGLGVLVCLSRSALYPACADGVPSARPDGLGATVAGVVPRTAAGLGVLLAATAAALGLAATGAAWWLGAVAVAAGALTIVGLLMRCVRRFGGITGDVLGAAIEVDLLVLLVVVASA